MKKLAALSGLLLFIASVATATDSTFTISGELEAIKSGTLFLNIYGGEEQQLTSKIKDGKFSFKGVVSKPVEAFITFNDKEQDYLSFYLEPGNIRIAGRGTPIKDLVVSNSPLNEDNKLLKEQMKAVINWEEANAKVYEKASAAKNKAVLDSLDEVDFKVLAAKRKIVAAFVKDHPRSMRSAMAIAENYAYYAEADEVQPLYDLLDDTIKNTPKGKELRDLVDLYQTVAIGRIAPEITQATPDGKSISLSSLKGKYVLVDFWASWCPPCRRENPHIVELFNKYNAADFDIFGVSCDTKKEKWQKAIADDGLLWQQVSDLQGWKNAAADLYGIKAIPSNLLLDKNGTIIAKNIFGKKLAETLENLVK